MIDTWNEEKSASRFPRRQLRNEPQQTPVKIPSESAGYKPELENDVVHSNGRFVVLHRDNGSDRVNALNSHAVFRFQRTTVSSA